MFYLLWILPANWEYWYNILTWSLYYSAPLSDHQVSAQESFMSRHRGARRTHLILRWVWTVWRVQFSNLVHCVPVDVIISWRARHRDLQCHRWPVQQRPLRSPCQPDPLKTCNKKGKGKFLYSAVSSPQDRSKCFYTLLPRQTCSINYHLNFQPHATINVRKDIHHCLLPGTHLYSWVNWSIVQWKYLPKVLTPQHRIQTRVLLVESPELYSWGNVQCNEHNISRVKRPELHHYRARKDTNIQLKLHT